MGNILGLGEGVIDFLPQGNSEGALLYKACPGGSVANFCVSAAKMGAECRFLGRLGNDGFGRYLINSLNEYGVNTDFVQLDKDNGTFLSFVCPEKDGENTYSFLNVPGADKKVTKSEIKEEMLEWADVVHVSSSIMSDEIGRETQLYVMEKTKLLGGVLSYDVNYRPALYANEKKAIDIMKLPLLYADIVKATEEELKLLTGKDKKEGAKELLKIGCKIIVITKGKKGSEIYTPSKTIKIKGESVRAVDSTGAGDCYFGTFIATLLRFNGRKIAEVDICSLQKAAEIAGRAASISVTRWGSMNGMPFLKEMEEYI